MLTGVHLLHSLKHGPQKADYVDDVFNVINWRQARTVQLWHIPRVGETSLEAVLSLRDS